MFEVREATDDELVVVWQVMREAFEEYRGVLDPPSGALTETVDDVRSSAAKGGAIIAWLDGEPVASARWERREGYLYCWRLGVLPRARGRGLATAVLEAVHRRAEALGYPEVRLSTREVMQSNLRMYERLGYVVLARQAHPAGEGIVVELVKHVGRLGA